MDEPTADLMALGAGMAGLTAAAVAASAGASVLVSERGPKIGGNAAHAMGKFWTATSYESLRTEDPDGNPVLHRAMFDTYPQALDWIRSTGVSVSEPIDVLHDGRGHLIDILGYLDRCRSIIEAHGGFVVPSTESVRLEIDRGGVVRGVWLRAVGSDTREEISWFAHGGRCWRRADSRGIRS